MAGPVRPLLVSTAYPPSLGGAQLHAHQLMQALARAGHDPHVATVWSRSRSDWLRGTTVRAPMGPVTRTTMDGIDVHRLAIDSRRRAVAVAGAFYPALLTGVGEQTMRRAATALFRDALEQVVAETTPDVMMLTRIGRAHLYGAAVAAARAAGLGVVLTPNHHAGWTRRRDRWWWDLYRQADAVLALSDAEVDLLVAGGVAPDRIHRTTVGIVGSPQVPARSDPEPSWPTVAFLGQAHPYKGIDLLAAAWPSVRAAVPDARLEIMGPWHRGQQRLHDRLAAMPGVTVHGPVDEATKWRVLADARVLAVPSQGESLGGVYLEAWAAGAVPVGADIAPVRELLAGAGRVVPRDPQPLADTLLELLHDQALCQQLVRVGRDRLAVDHDWDRIAAVTADVLSTVRAGTSSSGR